MKSERRHELEKNALAQGLVIAVEKIKPHVNTILWGAIGAVALFLIVKWLVAWHEGANEVAWDKFYEVAGKDPAELEKVAEDNPRSVLSDRALLTAANHRVAVAAFQLFTNKAMAKTELRKAEEDCRKVLGESQNADNLQWATFTLARLKETSGELDEAIKLYEQVKASGFAEVASQRIETLKLQGTKEFQDRLAQAQPEPSPLEKPLSKGPDFNEKAIPEGPAAKPAEKVGEKPAEKAAAKPAEQPTAKPVEKPAAKPAEQPAEKPAAKPAEKPADKPAEKPAEKAKPQTPAKPSDDKK